MSRVAIVTGGTRGIGEAISVALTKAGYKVAANYAGNDERAANFAEKTGIAIYKWDVADFEQCVAGVAKVEAELGPVAVLVNNAGVTRDGTMRRMEREGWDHVLDTNLGGCFNMGKAVWDGMLARNFGRIVNIGSINGQAGQYGQVNYAAAKSGIHGFTKALAQEGAAKGITVNAIAPGYIDTDMVAAVPRTCAGEDRGAHSCGPPRQGRGNRPRRAIPRCRRCGIRHRLDHVDQWRAAYVLTACSRRGRSTRVGFLSISKILSCIRGQRVLFRGLNFVVQAGPSAVAEGTEWRGQDFAVADDRGFSAAVRGHDPFATATADIGDTEERGEFVGWLGHHDAVKPQLLVREQLAFWARLYGGAGDPDAEMELLGFCRWPIFPANIFPPVRSAAWRWRGCGLSAIALFGCSTNRSRRWIAQANLCSPSTVAAHCAAGGIVLAATHDPLGITCGKLNLGGAR